MWLLGIIVVAATLVVYATASVITLECHPSPDGDNTNLDDQQRQQRQTCQFHIPVDIASGRQSLDQTCFEDPKTGKSKCVSGILHISTQRMSNSQSYPNEVAAQDGEVRPKEKIPTPYSEEKKVDTLSNMEPGHDRNQEDKENKNDSRHQETAIHVGRATYQPPYSQHGFRVATILRKAPILDAAPQLWAEWYFELGTAHYPRVNQSPSDDEVWEQVELAMNAYEASIQTIQERISERTVEHDLLAAKSYYHLGDANFLDPELARIQSATDAYRKSYHLYETSLKRLSQQAGTTDQQREEHEYLFAETCSKLGSAMLASMDPLEKLPTWYSSSIVQMDPTFGDSNADDGLSQVLLDEVHGYFQTAIRIFKEHIENHKSSGTPHYIKRLDGNPLELSFALTLQQAASVASMKGQLQHAKNHYEVALQILLNDLFPKLSLFELEYYRTSIADLCLSLSDACVHLGDYPCAKDSYAKAMDYYAKYQIPVASMAANSEGNGEIDAMISQTLATLQEYRGFSASGGSAGHDPGLDMSEGEEGDYYYYEQNDGYEGDLLASLGTLYLYLEDPRAITYMEQAREKYSKLPEDRESPNMASLLVNLAMAYYRNSQFEESKASQIEALNIYQRLYGDGANPYSQGLDEELIARMEEMGMDTGGNRPNSWPSADSSSEYPMSATNVDVKEKEIPKGTAEKKIDLDFYASSIRNFTKEEGNEDLKDEL